MPKDLKIKTSIGDPHKDQNLDDIYHIKLKENEKEYYEIYQNIDLFI